ncbi:MAG: MlaD family protein [Burkholderiaceae bacterium]
MEPEPKYTLIGASVIALVLALAGALVWLSGAGSADSFRNYRIVFEKQSLEGLQVGSDVNMRGVKVGRVTTFGISRENINRVTVKVRVDRETPVSTNTEAIINRNLVTGLARVDLVTPGEPGPPLVSSASDAAEPTIAEGRANLDAITESASSLIVSARQGLDALNEVLSPENRRNIRDILAGVRETTANLDARLASLTEAAVSFNETASQMGQSFTSLSAGVAPLTQDAQAALKQMRGTLREVARAAKSMERNTSLLTQRAGDAADVGLSEIRATAQEFRNGVDSLSRTLDRVRDPRSAILGPGQTQLGPGESQ